MMKRLSLRQTASAATTAAAAAAGTDSDAASSSSPSSTSKGVTAASAATTAAAAAPPLPHHIHNQHKASTKSQSATPPPPPPPPSTTIKLDPLHAVTARIAVLRVCFVVSLFAAAAACGYISYSRIKNLEVTVGVNTYHSVTTSALDNAKAIAKRKFKGSDVTASVLRHAFPNASQWPLEAALKGYVEISSQIAEQSATLTQGLNVIVRPDQVEEFEKHAYEVYRSQGYPETAGVSQEFGFGIFGMEANGTRYHRTTTEKIWDGHQNDILVPIFQHNNMNAPSILLDVYSRETQGRVIDSQLECTRRHAQQHEALIAAGGTLSPEQENPPDCSSVTDFTTLLIREGPAALFYRPLYPANDPHTMVAVVASTLHWEEVLLNVVPGYIKGPIFCVVSSDTASYTFSIESGRPKLLGKGDFHDRRYTKFGSSTVLTGLFTKTAAISMDYTLTLYPSEDVFSEFSTNSPLAVSLGFVGVIFFCAFVFFAYDFLVKHESHQRKTILEVKRRFVRFISHEIRTPLNTVCMGLEYLKEDMARERERTLRALEDQMMRQMMNNNNNNNNQNSIGNVNSNDSSTSLFSLQNHDQQHQQQLFPHNNNYINDASTSLSITSKQLAEWIDLTSDIVDNSTDAVLVLNDLLNYDKIESGALKLDLEEEDLYDRTSHVVSQLEVEAKQRNVRLGFHFENLITEPTPALAPADAKKNKKNKGVDNVVDIEMGTQHSQFSSTMKTKNIVNDYHQYCALADGNRLGQVLRNITSNALKFTPKEGSVDVSLVYSPDKNEVVSPETSNSSGGKKKNKKNNNANYSCNDENKSTGHVRIGTARISVKDTGIGMTTEQLKQLYGEGVQFDANKLQAGGGSGLGLWVSKGIVESHFGRICAESDGHEKGCTFTIFLPLYKSKNIDEKNQDSWHSSEPTVPSSDYTGTSFPHGAGNNGVGSAAGGTGVDPFASQRTTLSAFDISGHGGVDGENGTHHPTEEKDPEQEISYNVLVAEDSVPNRKMLIRLLERNGHNCSGVCDGQEAVNAISKILKKKNNTTKQGMHDDDSSSLSLEKGIERHPDGQDEKEEDNSPTSSFNVILMDYEMPNLNGPEATKEIRDLGYTGIILGVTGNVLKEDVDFFKQCGANDVLSKPVRYADIQDALLKLRRNQQHRYRHNHSH